MSREKAAKLMAQSDVDRAAYTVKRNQRPHWQRLSGDEWKEYCRVMADWFANQAPDEFNNYVLANNARKAESDAKAKQEAPFKRAEQQKKKAAR